MSGYKCFIFDDDASALVEISFLIGKYAPDWKIIGIASTVEGCRSVLKEQTPDIIFTDIHFGQEIIFDIIRELKAFKGDIVFISGDSGYASKALQLSAVNYFLKPINALEFKNFIEAYSKNQNRKGFELYNETIFHNLNDEQSNKKISFFTNSGYIVKELNKVLYAKAINEHTEFCFTDHKKYTQEKSLMSYEKTLEETQFFRIHPSYLVNKEFIQRFDIERLQVYLTTGETLPVSNRRKTELLEILS